MARQIKTREKNPYIIVFWEGLLVLSSVRICYLIAKTLTLPVVPSKLIVRPAPANPVWTVMLALALLFVNTTGAPAASLRVTAADTIAFAATSGFYWAALTTTLGVCCFLFAGNNKNRLYVRLIYDIKECAESITKRIAVMVISIIVTVISIIQNFRHKKSNRNSGKNE